MKLERPKIQRIYVKAQDANTRESKTVTLYDATVAEFIADLLQRAGAEEPMPLRRRRAQTLTA